MKHSRFGVATLATLPSGVTALLLAWAIPAWGSIQRPASTAPLVFDGVTVVDVEQGKLVPDQRVVIAGNRIRAVGSGSAVNPPDGAQIVDARGKYLIPGLWDMNVHNPASVDIAPLLLANGVTGIRDAGSSSMVGLEALIERRQETVAGTRVGPPRQILSGAAIVGPFPHCNRSENLGLSICVADTADARRYVDSLKASGADMVTLSSVTKVIWPVMVAEAHRLGMLAGGTGGDAEAITAIEASNIEVNLIDGQVGIRDCWLPRGSFERCQESAKQFRRTGTWFVPTMVGSPYLMGKHAAEIAWCLTASGASFRADSLPAGNWLHACRSLAPVTAAAGSMSVAERVGLPILAGTSSGGLDMDIALPGFSLHAELAMYVVEGLTPLHALQSATLEPAKMLHATDSLGTVAPGKLADLVLLDANPLEDITNTTTIRAVVANGRYYDRAALDEVLAEAR